ncbi:MAG: exodeoxyribonuclease VII small subunit [Pseudomonadota bacterium]
MAAKKDKVPDFEKSLAELEKIVNRMEQGDQSLDETMRDFEKGMKLSQACQKSLDEAQLKVEKLVEKHGGYELQDVSDDDWESDDEV